MLAQYLDLTDEFNANYYCQFETSNYDYAVVQIIGNQDEIYFYSTIDSGALQGATDGNILTSINYAQIVGKNIATGTYIEYSPANGMIVRFDIVGRYIRLDGTSFPGLVSKILVMLAKIS